MIIDQLFTQPLFEDIADPNRLIVSVTIQPMSTGGEPMKKEIDLTGQFQGNTRSQMEQAMDYLTKMLESKGLNFTTLQARYQGSIMNQNNQGTMAPQSDWEREAEAKAAQMRAQARAQRPAQNATPAIKEGAADPKRAKLERMIWKYFGQIYDYGDDDGLNYLDEQGELWNQLMDKYNGEIDDIVAQEPIEVLMQAAQELKGIAGDMKYELDEQGVVEGEVTKNATGLKHRATDKYGAGDDEPHHYTGGRSGFSEPGKYARDLEHVNKQLVKDLDASMGISWKNRGPKGLEVDEQGVTEGEYDSRKPFGVRYKVFAGREGRVTTREYWTSSEQKLQRAVAKIEALDNFYEIDGYSYPKEPQDVTEGSHDPAKDELIDALQYHSVDDPRELYATLKEIGRGFKTPVAKQIRMALRSLSPDDAYELWETALDIAGVTQDDLDIDNDMDYSQDVAATATGQKKTKHKIHKTIYIESQGVAEGYTGRETKAGTWRVFKDGNAVAAAGPFKSADEAAAWIKKHKQGITEGVAETVSMDQAKKVLRHYGADHFKTTTNELHFYKNGRPMSVDLIFNSDATRSVSLRQMNSATRKLKGQGITEMDKSEPSAGRDGGPREGPEKIAKPITKEKMVKHALDALSKSMAKKDDKKKDVKESDTLMLKLRRAMVQEGRVKELADDLKIMSDADFMKKYGKAKAAIRKDMKRIDEKLSTSDTLSRPAAGASSSGKAIDDPDIMGSLRSGSKFDRFSKTDSEPKIDFRAGLVGGEPEVEADPRFMVDPLPDMQKWGGKFATGSAGGDNRFTAPAGWRYVEKDEDPARYGSAPAAAAAGGGLPDLKYDPQSRTLKSADALALDLSPKSKFKFDRATQSQVSADGSGGNPNIDNATRDRARAWAAKQNAPADAAKQKVDWKTIYALNKATIGSNPNVIRPRMELNMPNGTIYLVQPGDTLTKIAAKQSQINELSTDKLAQYKTAAAKDAKEADKEGDFKRGDKRFHGIVQATKKQFDNDAKKVDESRAARRALMARIVNSR